MATNTTSKHFHTYENAGYDDRVTIVNSNHHYSQQPLPSTTTTTTTGNHTAITTAVATNNNGSTPTAIAINKTNIDLPFTDPLHGKLIPLHLSHAKHMTHNTPLVTTCKSSLSSSFSNAYANQCDLPHHFCLLL